MANPVPISLGFRSNAARNPQAGRAELINCFAEETSQDAKIVWTIYNTEGLTALGSALAGGGIRAGLQVGSTAYVISGRNVYAVASSGASTLIGGIATDGPVYMQRNRRIPAQIGIVSEGFYYVIDTGANSIAQIFDVNLTAPISISFLQGYGILPTTDGDIQLTQIDDFTVIDALAVGNAEAFPDGILRSMTLESEALFFGEDSLQFFQDTGADPFPLTPVQSLEIGWLAGDSLAKVDTPTRKTIIGVASDHTVRMINGYSAQVISTNEIEEMIKTLDEAGNAAQLKGMAWAYAGRFFYALTCNDWTRVYDSKTGYWHTRKSYGLDRWRVSTVFKFGNKLIAGDYTTGQLYTMSNTVYTEDGNYLVSEIITPHIHAFPYKLKFNALYVDAATGVGLNSTDVHASDPKLLVSWSDDSGYSWSPEVTRALGTDAEYRRITPVRRMGRSKNDKGRLYRLRISAPVPRVTMQMLLDFDKLEA